MLKINKIFSSGNGKERCADFKVHKESRVDGCVDYVAIQSSNVQHNPRSCIVTRDAQELGKTIAKRNKYNREIGVFFTPTGDNPRRMSELSESEQGEFWKGLVRENEKSPILY